MLDSIMNAIWNVCLDLAPWLFFGAILSALLHKWLPRTLISTQLRGKFGVLKGVMLGVPLPLCSCGVIPAGLGLKKDGSSDGAAMGFLISTPQTGIDSALVSASFLGWPFAIFKLVAAAITGIIGGLIVDSFDSADSTKHSGSGQPTRKTSWADAWDHGVQLIRSIWGWLTIGILLSALITIMVPETLIATSSEGLGTFGASLVALVISTPLYVCATASVPIAASLVTVGFPKGAALVFLMAGPATNIATIGAVREGFGNRSTLIYLLTVIIGSLLLGMTFDFLIPDPQAQAINHHEGGAIMDLISQLSAGILLLSIAWFSGQDFIRSKLFRALFNEKNQSTEQRSIRVEGLTCGGCVAKLERHLTALDSIHSVEVQLKPGLATISGSISQADLHQGVIDAGFTPIAINESA